MEYGSNSVMVQAKMNRYSEMEINSNRDVPDSSIGTNNLNGIASQM